MEKRAAIYKIAISYANGRDVVIYNSFESITDMIKNYTQYNDVKNMRVKPNSFLKDEKLKIATYISQYLG